MEAVYSSHSYEETRQIAKDLISKITSGTTICLHGDLSAGKTTFSQGVGQALGLSRIISPTFLIMREYPITAHPQIKTLYHLDLYRLQNEEEIRSFDLDEIWDKPDNLLLIEWPEKINSSLPSKRLDVYFEIKDENTRLITIKQQK